MWVCVSSPHLKSTAVDDLSLFVAVPFALTLAVADRRSIWLLDFHYYWFSLASNERELVVHFLYSMSYCLARVKPFETIIIDICVCENRLCEHTRVYALVQIYLFVKRCPLLDAPRHSFFYISAVCAVFLPYPSSSYAPFFLSRFMFLFEWIIRMWWVRSTYCSVNTTKWKKQIVYKEHFHTRTVIYRIWLRHSYFLVTQKLWFWKEQQEDVEVMRFI